MNIKFIQDESIEENLLELRAREKSMEIVNIIESISNISTRVINLYDKFDIYSISYSDIIKFYCDKGEVFAIANGKSMKVKKKLYEIEEICNETFIKINNHEIINSSKIDHFDLSLSGIIYVELIDGSKAKVSRRKVKSIKKYFGI